ncbi:hypothetical protein [Bacillus sp. JJ722]
MEIIKEPTRWNISKFFDGSMDQVNNHLDNLKEKLIKIERNSTSQYIC